MAFRLKGRWHIQLIVSLGFPWSNGNVLWPEATACNFICVAWGDSEPGCGRIVPAARRENIASYWRDNLDLAVQTILHQRLEVERTKKKKTTFSSVQHLPGFGLWSAVTAVVDLSRTTNLWFWSWVGERAPNSARVAWFGDAQHAKSVFLYWSPNKVFFLSHGVHWVRGCLHQQGFLQNCEAARKNILHGCHGKKHQHRYLTFEEPTLRPKRAYSLLKLYDKSLQLCGPFVTGYKCDVWCAFLLNQLLSAAEFCHTANQLNLRPTSLFAHKRFHHLTVLPSLARPLIIFGGNSNNETPQKTSQSHWASKSASII